MSRSLLLVLVATAVAACGTPTPEPVAAVVAPVAEPAPAPAHADGVFFTALEDGAEVDSPVHVGMEVYGMVIAPAGEVEAGQGHHHIIVDGEAIPAGTVVPADETHIHFGHGQTETDVELTPGPHTLTLQLANGVHESYGPDWSRTIHVTVKGE